MHVFILQWQWCDCNIIHGVFTSEEVALEEAISLAEKEDHNLTNYYIGRFLLGGERIGPWTAADHIKEFQSMPFIGGQS